LPNGLRSKRKHMKTADVIQVADFFGDGSVAIQENGGRKRDSFNQEPPPRNEASYGPRPRPLLGERWSCSDGL
jgi:hypothetical protein